LTISEELSERSHPAVDKSDRAAHLFELSAHDGHHGFGRD
jgi:hypothetical protein